MISFLMRITRERGLRFFRDYFVEAIWFDLRHRTDTAMRVTKDKQAPSVESDIFDNGLLYVASFTSVITKTVGLVKAHCDQRSGQLGNFVDLGCGKGKTLIVVHETFRNDFSGDIIGIEYDRNLVAIGHSNLKTCGLGDEVTLVEDTAVNVTRFINAAVHVIYLYNSFQGETLRAVLQKLSGVEHYLIYVDPVEAALLSQRNYSELYANEGRYNADSWKIYHYDANVG